jgi:20S proteasome alpha/beta subunit
MDSEGNRIKGDLFSVGSGSMFAYGILDSYYKWDMTMEQSIALGKRAINEAAYNDAASGGVVRGNFFGFKSEKSTGFRLIVTDGSRSRMGPTILR